MYRVTTCIILLFTTLFSVVKSVAQSTLPDVACVGSTKNYFVIATPGSSYVWKVDGGIPEASNSNAVDITWKTKGVKTLTVQEVTKDHCVGQIQSLQVTVNEASYSKTTRIVCPLQLPFKWNGISCTSAGIFRTTLTNSVGCDSIAELELGVEDPLVTRLEQWVCKSEMPYQWNNQQLKSEGTYSQKFTTVAGCDSIVYLKLVVPRQKMNIVCDTICLGESCVYAGKSFSNQGIYTETIKDELGCDSVLTLHLTVETGKTTTQRIQLYTGELFKINGNTYTEAGTYIDRIKVGAKCEDELITELSFMDVPNSITPNGDGINDVFMSGHRVKIYNRNGVLLHDGNDGWDGKYKGNLVGKGTYFYVLFNADITIKPKEGYITILR